ncbi:MAG: hypothetical protein QG671_2298 [Actinomycetota bacterium]|nr:hypothetical protein [Actinomycetota bacterium]
MRNRWAVCLMLSGSLVVGACGATDTASAPTRSTVSAAQSAPDGSPSAGGSPAVVLVSGLATQTPFTTTTAKCASGLSAGNSVSALRDSLIAAGNQVYTAPAQIGPGEVTSTVGIGPSSDCPTPLPATLTIDTTAGIDQGGEHLAAFLNYLHTQHGVTAVQLVSHSMGGLFSRSAIGQIGPRPGGLEIRSLTALSTPWTGAFPADYAEGKLPLSACAGERTCLQVMTDYKAKLSDVEGPQGAANAIGTSDLQGPTGWNVAQGTDLADIPVTLIGGDHFARSGGSPKVWPNDGIVSASSALARGIDGAPLRVRACLLRPDVHTIGMAAELGLPWTSSITWDPVVLAAVAAAVRAGDSGTPTADGATDC